MWLEYARLEMSYIAKIHARREILGITKSDPDHQAKHFDEDENVLHLPELAAIDVNPDVEGDIVDSSALQNLESTPAMSGAIPIAIFDAAVAHFPEASFALDFFNMVLEYEDLPICRKIADHVEAKLWGGCPQNWCAQVCHIQLPLVSVSPNSPEFPAAFRHALVRLKEARSKTSGAELASWAQGWLQKLVDMPNLDPGIEAVGNSILRSLETS